MSDFIWMEENLQPNVFDFTYKPMVDSYDMTLSENLLSENYFRTKEEEKEQQKTTIAIVHYRINILSDQFHKWRLFCIQQRVQKRMTDVALVHREDQILSSFFATWRAKHRESCSIKEKERYEVLKNTFSTWRKIHLLHRVVQQRKLQLAKEYHLKHVLKLSFQRWRENLDVSKADRLHQLHQERRAFKLWQLQHLKRRIQRRLARAHRRKALQRCFLNLWAYRYQEKLQNRSTFIEKLNAVFLRRYLIDWFRFTKTQRIRREHTTILENQRQRNALRSTFTTWKWKHGVKQFTLRHRDWEKKYLERKYYQIWRLRIKKNNLMSLVDQFQTRKQMLHLKGCFRQWQQEYQIELTNHQKAMDIRSKLAARKLMVIFFHWRIVTQQDLLIKPLVMSIQHKQGKCCFEAWHQWTSLKTKSIRFLTLHDQNTVRQMFIRWRTKSGKLIEEQKAKDETERAIVKKCLCKWNDFVFQKKARRKQRVENYARLWLDITQQRKLDREIVKADQANMKLLERVYFYKWKHRSQASQCKRIELENKANAFLNERRCYITLAVWARQLEVKQILRNHLYEKKMELLRKTFEAWLKDTQREVESQITGFNLHFDTKINKSVSSSRRGSMPVFSSHYANSVSTFPRFNQQSLDASALRRAYKNQTHKQAHDAEAKSVTPFTGQSASPEDTLCSEDPLNLQSFTYDSDYEMTLESSEEKSETQQSLNLDLNNTTCSDFPDCSASDSKYFGSNPPSWTNHWKRRYQQSKETAKLRRLSHVTEFQPPVCSTARTGVAVINYEACNSSRKSSFNSSFGGSSTFSFNSIQLGPKQPEILNRTFPFVRKKSNEELLTSGVYSIVTDDDNTSIVSTIMPDSKNDKEMLLVGTLQYWRNLDVSTVFYAWLKYTARKRFLRQMQDSLLERKREYLLHTMFLKWNCEWYGRNASSDFWWKLTARRAFKQWQKYTSLERWKTDSNHLAEDKYRRLCLSKYLKCWKEKRNQKQTLSNFAKLWVASTMKMEAHEAKVLRHQQRWNVVLKTSYFAEWRLMLRKQEIADQHYTDTLLNKTLNTWWCHNLVKETRRKKVKNFQTQHLVAKKFDIWRRKMYCLRQVEDLQTSKQDDLKKMVFHNWLIRTRAKREDREKILFAINKKNNQLEKDAFVEWVVYWRQLKTAQLHHKTLTCKKALTTWFSFTSRRKEQETNLQRVVSIKENNTLQRTFQWWRACAVALTKYREKYQTSKIELMTHCLVTWRKSCLQQKGVRFYEHKSVEKSFALWKNHYVLKNKEMSLMKNSSKKWKSRLQISQKNETNMEMLVHTKNEIVLNETFILWKHQTQMSMIAKQHHHKVLFTSMLQHWSKYVTEKKQRNLSLDEHRRRCRNKLVQSAFRLWKERKQKSVILQKIQKKMMFWKTKKYANKWRLQTKVNQYERHRCKNRMKNMLNLWREELKLRNACQTFYNVHLLKRCIRRWKDFHLEEQKQKEIEKNRLKIAEDYNNNRIKKRIFHHWEQQTSLSSFERRRREKLSRKYFEKWLERVAMMQLADSMYRQNLLNKMWFLWRKEVIRKNVVDNFIKQDRRKLLSEVLLGWFDYTGSKSSFPPDTHHMEIKKVWFRKWMTMYNQS